MAKTNSKAFYWLIPMSLTLVAIIVALIWFSWATSPIDPASKQSQSFIVRKGDTVDEIGQKLKATGLIRSQVAFKITIIKNRLAKKIQAGSFTLSPAMNTPAIANGLTQGRQDIWITLLEGWRREEIAQNFETTLTKNGVAFSAATFLELTKDKEGYLFPDTYLIPLTANESVIVNILETTFTQKVTQGLAAEITKSTHSLKDVVIMASLLEREANRDDQMRHVAGILYNRLQIGMALQVDATLQYAKGYNSAKKSWWEPPIIADKEIKSPYNTYLNPGLPPAPIANPGLSAIKAALNPLETDDFYYLHAPDGSIYYAKTLEQHNANVAKYLK